MWSVLSAHIMGINFCQCLKQLALIKWSILGGGITLGQSEESPEKASSDAFYFSSTPLELYPAAAIRIPGTLQNSSDVKRYIFPGVLP
jgi:hypothetical protein